MSEQIPHECGLALVRLRQGLSHYCQRYSDPAWGLRKLYLMMEKQHNRGQDGAGVATVKFDMPPGVDFVKRIRSDKHNALERVFDTVMSDVNRLSAKRLQTLSEQDLKRRCTFLGEATIGHLRYGTHSGHSVSNCHPFIRRNNTASRNLAIAGNFNMTNSSELFEQLVEWGLNPVGDSDTQVILERLGYCLDREHEHLRATMGPDSLHGLEGRALAKEVSNQIDLVRMLTKASENWDGGYMFVGLLGNGDAFACRDPAGIRPGFFYLDEEVLAVASERAALANVFDVEKLGFQASFLGAFFEISNGLSVVFDVAQAGEVQQPFDPHPAERFDEILVDLSRLITTLRNEAGRHGLFEPNPLKDS